MKLIRSFATALSMAVILLQSSSASPTQATATQAKSTSPSGKQPPAATASAPSAQEIADAKSKGMVWANARTKVYHKDGTYYGTTKHGKFMTEDEAKQAGYRAAKSEGGAKRASTTSTSPK